MNAFASRLVDLTSKSQLKEFANIFRSSELTETERRYQLEDEQLRTKMWRPLRKLYRQHLFHNLLPPGVRRAAQLNTISVLNVSTNFFCRKSSELALIEADAGRFERPCPQCIADSHEVGTNLNVEKVKRLINVMRDRFGLQVVTFVGHGEPLEKDGHRATVFELIEHVHRCGLVPQVYTGGHSLDQEALDFLKEYQVSVLLSTYGLPFLRSDIFDAKSPLRQYSDITAAPDGRLLLFSQRRCAEMAKELFSRQVAEDWETDTAISIVVTPEHAGNPNKLRDLKNFATMAKVNGLAVFAWEEYRKAMGREERAALERTARLFSSWAELGSLYVWNRCLFGTGGSVTILGNGQVTHCPHTTASAGFGLDDLIDESGQPISEGVEKLQAQAHKFDKMSCIVRGTRVGEREPALVPLKYVLGGGDLCTFLDQGFEEFPYIAELWNRQEFIHDDQEMRRVARRHLEQYLSTDYLWFTLLNKSSTKLADEPNCLSPAQRYIYDEQNDQSIWQKVAAVETGHLFHRSEIDLLEHFNVASKITGESVVVLGLGEKEDRIIQSLSPQNRTLCLVDIRKSITLEKARRYEALGFRVQILSCLFEDLGDEEIVERIVAHDDVTVVVLGSTAGNFPQRLFWRNLLKLRNPSGTLQLIASLQVTSSIDREQHMRAIESMYDEENFRAFAFKPFDDQLNRVRFYVAENGSRRPPIIANRRLFFDPQVENGLGGIVGIARFGEECRWENALSSDLIIPNGTEIELYRSLKPDLHTYMRFLRTTAGPNAAVSLLATVDDVALFELRVGVGKGSNEPTNGKASTRRLAAEASWSNTPRSNGIAR